MELPSAELEPLPDGRELMVRIHDVMRQMLADGCPPDGSEVTHDFTPGLYCRTIVMPAGVAILSKIHKTCHPYFIQRGRVSVWTAEEGWKTFEAPHRGVTQPGTQRLLFVHEETEWTTAHPTTLTDLAEIEAAIIEPFLPPPPALEAQPELEENQNL
jgi:hypothetical protein